MAGPQGIQGMQRFRAVINPQAPPEQMHGGPVDPYHAHHGEQSSPYPWEEFAGPRGPYNPADDAMLGDPPEYRTLAAGQLYQDPSGDQTPYRTHAAPNIRGMEMDPGPEGNARVLQQSAIAHAVKTGASRKGIQSSNPLQDHWDAFFNPVVGEDMVTAVVPDGQRGPSAFGIGVNDHTSNPFAKRNPYGLDSAHRHRRYASSPIPGNTMWMKPGGRPMVKTLAGPSRPATGEGPFSGQDPTRDWGTHGVVLTDPATEYQAPPQPYVTPTIAGQESAPVIELW